MIFSLSARLSSGNVRSISKVLICMEFLERQTSAEETAADFGILVAVKWFDDDVLICHRASW